MYKISGLFNIGNRYTEYANNKTEFLFTLEKIYNNPCCMAPDSIENTSGKQLPKYILEYIQTQEKAYKWE